MYIYVYFVIFLLIFNNNAYSYNEYISEENKEDSAPIEIVLEADFQAKHRDYEVEVVPKEICTGNEGNEDCQKVFMDNKCAGLIKKDTKRTFKIRAPSQNIKQGYCLFNIHYRPVDRKRFNTKKFKIDIETNQEDRRDNINDTVICKVYFSKTNTNIRKKRCIEFRDTEEDDDNFGVANIRGHPMSEADLNFINSLDPKQRTTKDILIINKNTEPNEAKKTCPHCNKMHLVVDEQKLINFNKECTFLDKLKLYLNTNKYTFLAFGAVITAQCVLICAMVYCLTKYCACIKDKKIVRHYFNYRQDASMTTPLICTSNNGTETGDCKISQDSIPDKTIKCYKACKDESKISITDDVISKCINRRNWERNVTQDDKIKTDLSVIQDKADTKVTFENEIEPANIQDCMKTEIENRHVQCDLSEKEINCHTYLCKEKKNKSRFGFFKSTSFSTSKSDKDTQAIFPKDSLDDFLAERMKNKSNFTPLESRSSLSSRTSKNFSTIKSLLFRKSKTSSVPGVQSKKNVNLELLHMSRASDFSSSSSRLKQIKDSRTSL